MSDVHARERYQRDRENVIALAVLAVICIASSAIFYHTGGPTRGWNAMLFLASLGVWAFSCKRMFHTTSTALLRRAPEWPERFEFLIGVRVHPNPVVTRFWGNTLLVVGPITLVLLTALGYLLAIHTRANDAQLAVIMLPTMFAFLVAIGVCVVSLLEYRTAKYGYTVEPDEWSDGNGYVEGI